VAAVLERRLRIERQTTPPVVDRGVRIDCGYGLDLIVEGMVVVPSACSRRRRHPASTRRTASVARCASA